MFSHESQMKFECYSITALHYHLKLNLWMEFVSCALRNRLFFFQLRLNIRRKQHVLPKRKFEQTHSMNVNRNESTPSKWKVLKPDVANDKVHAVKISTVFSYLKFFSYLLAILDSHSTCDRTYQCFWVCISFFFLLLWKLITHTNNSRRKFIRFFFLFISSIEKFQWCSIQW